MPEAKGLKAEDLTAAMNRLLFIKAIELDAELWSDNHRHFKRRIRAKEGRQLNDRNPPLTNLRYAKGYLRSGKLPIFGDDTVSASAMVRGMMRQETRADG